MRMKSIHFDNLNNKFWLGVLILSLICVLIGLFEPIAFDNPSVYKYIMTSAYSLQFLFISKLFWFKNTVQWNKKGIVIRINSFLGKSLRFDEIRATELNGLTMSLTMDGGRKIFFDLNEFTYGDVLKLNNVMMENTIINN